MANIIAAYRGLQYRYADLLAKFKTVKAPLTDNEEYCADQDGRALEGSRQPIEVRSWNGEDNLYSELVTTAAHPAPPELPDEGSSHSHEGEGVKKRQRGRPVVYLGDPDAPGLNPEQRRQLLRRISNRESARRARNRHHEELASLCAKADDLTESCKALTAQVDALKLQRSLSEALEKRLTEELRQKDEQVKEAQLKSDALQSEICDLTLRLYAREQESLRLEMCLEMQGCTPAMSTPCGPLPCTEVPSRPGSGSLSQTWHHPSTPTNRIAEPIFDGTWLPYLDHAVGHATCPARTLHAGGQASPAGLVSSIPRESRPSVLPDMDMMLPEFSSSSEDAAQGSFKDIIRDLGLLPDIEADDRAATK